MAAYIKNNMPLQALTGTPRELLISTFEEILRSHPVPHAYQEDMQKGIFSGHTSLVFLMFRISVLHPDLKIQGYDLQYWAEKYLKPASRDVVIKDGYAGLHCEKMAVDALQACFTKRKEDVDQLLSSMPAFLGPYLGPDPFESEMSYGRSGVLYMLRLVKHFNPRYASAIEPHIESLAEHILASQEKTPWEFCGRQYLGPAHGDIGIITQLVLSLPSIAPRLTNQLRELLDLQLPDGNWPKVNEPEAEDKSLVQFCHGAPGFVFSLKSLRPFYPELHKRIDAAIIRGQELIWNRGLLRKEPSMCHGILGNAM